MTIKVPDSYRDPLMQQTLAHLREHNMTFAAVERKTGITASTMRRWGKDGPTKRPQATTLRFALRAIGLDLGIVPKRNT